MGSVLGEYFKKVSIYNRFFDLYRMLTYKTSVGIFVKNQVILLKNSFYYTIIISVISYPREQIFGFGIHRGRPVEGHQ